MWEKYNQNINYKSRLAGIFKPAAKHVQILIFWLPGFKWDIVEWK